MKAANRSRVSWTSKGEEKMVANYVRVQRRNKERVCARTTFLRDFVKTTCSNADAQEVVDLRVVDDSIGWRSQLAIEQRTTSSLGPSGD